MPACRDTCLYFIGGVIKHAKALNAFTNPTTNSYKRLVPGYEAPVLLAYSARNRSASCRIPYGAGEKAKRVEFRFPDPLANPYLRLLGAADGRPRRDREQDPSGRSDGQEPLRPAAGRTGRSADRLRFAARSARSARTRTTTSCSKGDVFTKDQIDAYIELKWEEVCASKPRRARSNSTCTIRADRPRPMQEKRAARETGRPFFVALFRTYLCFNNPRLPHTQ